MTSTPLMERPRNDRTYSAVVPGLVPTAFTHLAWRFRGGDKYRCRPGACPRDPLAFARGDAVCGLLPGQPLARSTLPRSEEHTSELQSLMRISYAVFCLKKKKTQKVSSAYMLVIHNSL